VTTVVPPDAPKPRTAASSPEALVQLPERQGFAIGVAEDARSLRVSARAARPGRCPSMRSGSLLAPGSMRASGIG
jgi:hypothetical protein